MVTNANLIGCEARADTLEAIRKPRKAKLWCCYSDSSWPSFSKRYNGRDDMAQLIG